MKNLIIALIVLIVIGGGIFLALNMQKIPTQEQPKPTPSAPVEKKSPGESVVVESVPSNNKTDKIIISGVYPRITSFENKEFENSINKEIATNISNYVREIVTIVDDKTPDVKLYRYTINFDKFAYGNYLTLVIEQDYETGGIRSNKWKDIYNIDASKERLIYLADLFEPGVDFEGLILKEVNSQALLNGWKLMDGDGVKKLPKTQKFYVKDNKLFIYYDPSEVAAATYGALEFEMPFVLEDNGYFRVR